MQFEDHCKECKEKLGRDFAEVHKWLDEFITIDRFGHRQYRHHKEGVEEVRKLFGNEAAKAAELHIMSDLDEIPTKEDWADADYWLRMMK